MTCSVCGASNLSVGIWPLLIRGNNMICGVLCSKCYSWAQNFFNKVSYR